MAELRIKRGDVWIVSFGSTIGHETKKTRPAVIIQNDIGNNMAKTTIVAPITSNKSQIYPFEVEIESGKIMCNHIRTIDKARLQTKIGKISALQSTQLDIALKRSLGII